MSIGSGDGKLSVINEASAGSVTIKATSGSVSATKNVTITKADPVPTTVTISGGVDSLTVPTVDAIGGSKFENAAIAFTAEVKDQYGVVMTDQTVTWSVTGNDGVTISDGVLTITNTATNGSVTVKAECGSASDTKSVSVSKTASAATFVQVKKADAVVTTDSITIPTSGSPANTVAYTAEVYDQYGTAFSDTINWSISTTTGVSVSGGTVTVDSTASEGTVTLTAASSSATSAQATVTITLSNKPVHNIGTFAESSKTITYGDAVTGQTVACTSGGTVKYSSSNSSAVEVNESTGALTVHKATTSAVTITAKVDEDAAHAEATASYTVTVSKKELTITGLTATNRDYAASNTAVALTGGTLTGVVGTDDVSVTMPTSGTITDANAGNGKVVAVATPSLIGADAGNYTLKAITGITVTINKIDPDVGTVSYTGGAIYTSTALSSITLSKTGSASGELKLTDGQTLTVGTKNYNWTFTPSDTTNYKTLTGTVSLTVSEDALSSISIGTTTPSKTSYKYGEDFETTGLTVTATYASGATQDVTAQVTFGALSVGQTSIDLTYQGKSCTVSGLTVSKADAPSLADIAVSQKYSVTTEQSKQIGSIMPTDAGTLTYTAGTSSVSGTAAVSSFSVDTSGLVKYTITGGENGAVITLPVTIGSDNYADSTVNVVITLTAKDDQAALTVTGGTTVVYGQTLTLGTSGGSGTGAVTYSVVNGTGEATIDASTGVLTPVKVGTVKVKVTKGADANFNEATSAEKEVTITRATPAGAPKYTKITTSGKTLADAGLTVTGSTLNPSAGMLEWVDNGGNVLPGTTVVAKNTTYKWRFIPTDTNYTEKNGSIELYHVSSSSGGGGGGSSSGGSSDPTYSVTAPGKTENGTVSVSPKSAKKGSTVTVTVTPDKGYTLETLTVLDKDGKEVKLTDKGDGKYTFTMPAGKVEVKAAFMDDNTMLNYFTDVPASAYYYDAVKWAAEKGITGGTDAAHFTPGAPCTRAQIVTFLWRAAGSPEPKNGQSGLSDVSESSYYAKAVAWAIENGVTTGTKDGRFDPSAVCTRAQAAAFLYRAAGSPAVGGGAGFDDVPEGAYYAAAVAWAKANGVTGGLGNGLFGSGNDCTRAQIVTFLFRAYQGK